MKKLMEAELEKWSGENYSGQRYNDYFVVVTQNRDSEPLERSNFRTALAMLGGEQGDDVVVARSGHFLVGWLEQLLVREGSDKVQTAQSIVDKLENSPILDEGDYSDEEQIDLAADWDSWGKDEAASYAKEWFQDEDLEVSDDLEKALYYAFYDAWQDGSGDFSADTFHTYLDKALAEYETTQSGKGYRDAEAVGQRTLGLEARNNMKIRSLVEKYLFTEVLPTDAKKKITESPEWGPYIYQGKGVSVFHPEYGTEYHPGASSEDYNDMGRYFDDLKDGGYDVDSVEDINGWFGKLLLPGPQNLMDRSRAGNIDSTEWVFAENKKDFMQEMLTEASYLPGDSSKKVMALIKDAFRSNNLDYYRPNID